MPDSTRRDCALMITIAVGAFTFARRRKWL
jgi:hypothetical protein